MKENLKPDKTVPWAGCRSKETGVYSIKRSLDKMRDHVNVLHERVNYYSLETK